MKVLTWLSMLIWLSSLWASGFYPQFERYVSPAYPSALRGGRIDTGVRVSYDIRNDGSVSNVKVLEKNDWKTGNAAVSAVKRWRFVPWEVTEQMPVTIGELVDFTFDEDRKERRLRMLITRQRRSES
jgi:TonB family protein